MNIQGKKLGEDQKDNRHKEKEEEKEEAGEVKAVKRRHVHFVKSALKGA